MKDQEKDMLRKVILELLKEGNFHWTDIEKKACATHFAFATTNTIKKQFYDYLLKEGYIEKISRGMYRISDRGRKLLRLLSISS